jgi:hypothetical protein
VEYLLVAWANSTSSSLTIKMQSGQSGYTGVLKTETYDGSFPATITGESTLGSRRVNIYCTYTVSGTRQLATLGVGT